MNQGLVRKEVLAQVQRTMLPALAMLDLRGIDDKVTLAMLIAEKALTAIYEEKDISPESIYKSAVATLAPI